MMSLDLVNIDSNIRENFHIIESHLQDSLIFRGQKLKVKFDKPGHFIVQHKLGKIPEDIILTKNSHLVIPQYDSMDHENIEFEVIKPCAVNVLIGFIVND